MERFRRAYCGLCHTLGRRYGPAARFILNYDFTYLAILLSAQEEGPWGQSRCLASPFQRRTYLLSTQALELAADESIILAYWQLRDGVEDHDWLYSMKYRALSAVLEPAYRRAAEVRPAFDQSTRQQLEILSALEKERCASMDRAADSFAVLLQGAAGEVEDGVQRRVLEQLLYHLGRWIYLADAADDLKQDAAEGHYNPVALRYGLKNGAWTEESRREFAVTLDHSVHMITTALALWDFGVWTLILEAAFYSGLFQTGRAVLDGSFHAKRKKRETQERST